MSDKVLEGKTALLTGSARGIGAACAKKLAAMGAKVIINYNSSEKAVDKVVAAIRKAGGKAEKLQADISKPAEIEAMFKTIDKKHGKRIDILVNNAAVFVVKDVPDLTLEDIQFSLNVNVVAVFLVTQQALARMPKGGRIINIGSAIGERSMFPGASAYVATKFAIAGMTRAWAREFAPRQITCNVIQPGPIDTEMSPDDPRVNPKADYLRNAVPLKRFGDPSEVAGAVGFLASPEGSFTSGARITVDGGWIS